MALPPLPNSGQPEAAKPAPECPPDRRAATKHVEITKPPETAKPEAATAKPQLRVKKLVPDAKVPTREPGSAGYDLYSTGDWNLPVGKVVAISTGIAMAIPEGLVGLICDRSGLALRGISTKVARMNAAALIAWLTHDSESWIGYTPHPLGGVIDANFRGELRVLLYNSGDGPHPIKKGDRIAQLILTTCGTNELSVVEVADLDATNRGNGGFGSTGR